MKSDNTTVQSAQVAVERQPPNARAFMYARQGGQHGTPQAKGPANGWFRSSEIKKSNHAFFDVWGMPE